MTEPEPDQPTGDPRRAHRCLAYTTAALLCGVQALIVLAASSALAGTRSPLHGYVGDVLALGVVLFAAGAACWIRALILRRDPRVRLAMAEADEVDRQQALADLEAEQAEVDAALLAAAAQAGVALVSTGDGTPGFSPQPPQPRPAPDPTEAALAP